MLKSRPWTVNSRLRKCLIQVTCQPIVSWTWIQGHLSRSIVCHPWTLDSGIPGRNDGIFNPAGLVYNERDPVWDAVLEAPASTIAAFSFLQCNLKNDKYPIKPLIQRALNNNKFNKYLSDVENAVAHRIQKTHRCLFNQKQHVLETLSTAIVRVGDFFDLKARGVF